MTIMINWKGNGFMKTKMGTRAVVGSMIRGFLMLSVVLMVLGSLIGCGREKEEFSIIGTWHVVIPFTEEESTQFAELYDTTHYKMYKDAVANDYTYEFSEDGKFTLTWFFVDKDGKPFSEPSDGAYNTGDVYEGTYEYKDGILYRSIIVDGNVIYTDEWSVETTGNKSFTITLIKLNDTEIKSGSTVLSFERL